MLLKECDYDSILNELNSLIKDKYTSQVVQKYIGQNKEYINSDKEKQLIQ